MLMSQCCRRLGRPDPEWAVTVGDQTSDTWETTGHGSSLPWRTAVARLSDRVQLRPLTTVSLEAATSSDKWIVSRAGSISAAEVVVDGEVAFTAVSVYAAWEMAAGRGYADGTAHRI